MSNVNALVKASLLAVADKYEAIMVDIVKADLRLQAKDVRASEQIILSDDRKINWGKAEGIQVALETLFPEAKDYIAQALDNLHSQAGFKVQN